jgi:acetyl esterase/lipase
MRLREAAFCAAMLGLAPPAAAQHLRPTDLAGMAVPAPSKIEAYGADPLQFGELRLPKGAGPFPVAVIIHGGCWTKGFATLSYMSPLAAALADRGVATWNIEYRQLGDKGGGWPGSFLDWAAATDHLRALAKAYPLDLTRVIVVGHSAGAHAALWVASRSKLATNSEIRGGEPLKISAAVAIDGPGELKPFIGPDQRICGKPVIAALMGGGPQDTPGHYAQGDPVELLPSGAPTVMISSAVLQPDEAERYRTAATAKGDQVEVLDLRGAAHFDMLDAKNPPGAVVQALIVQALALSRK